MERGRRRLQRSEGRTTQASGDAQLVFLRLCAFLAVTAVPSLLWNIDIPGSCIDVQCFLRALERSSGLPSAVSLPRGC